ncbi:MAG: hypothetical protein ACMXYE_04565 [Candidatus Woesearchaeota archaeon]
MDWKEIKRWGIIVWAMGSLFIAGSMFTGMVVAPDSTCCLGLDCPPEMQCSTLDSDTALREFFFMIVSLSSFMAVFLLYAVTSSRKV